MMRLYTYLVLICSLNFSCNESFINHTLKFENAGDCSNYSASIKITSNLYGERYEFYSCLDDGFDGKNYAVLRKGDSLVVDLPGTAALKKSLFKIILDIDAKPGYHHIVLDGRELTITSAEK